MYLSVGTYLEKKYIFYFDMYNRGTIYIKDNFFYYNI